MKRYLLITIPLLATTPSLIAKQKRPNVIIIMADDQGYQDLGCYGSPLIKTPVIDQLAADGLRLTDFYQSASVSSASRAGLLTGRLNSHNSVPGVYFPNENGLPTQEITLAEALKECGYSTACIGKWHLGDAPEHMPLNQGFDEYFGIPYSNDMYISPLIPISEDVNFREGYTMEVAKAHQSIAAKGRSVAIKSKIRNTSPLVEDGEIVEFPCDQTTLTRRYFDRAIEFIKGNKRNPFFAYITPAMPHYPLHASEQFVGTSARGLYGDCVEEIDWNIGRLISMLEEEGLTDNTIIIYTSDNGPSLNYKELGGCALPLRNGKFKHYEGGMRVPFIIRWDGVISAGEVSDAVVRSIDLFPTIMHYAGVKSFAQSLDGQNISKFLENTKRTAGLDEYVYVKDGEVAGVRKGDWVYLPFSGLVLRNAKNKAELFNLKDDISQNANHINDNPEKLAEMKALYEAHVANNQ